MRRAVRSGKAWLSSLRLRAFIWTLLIGVAAWVMLAFTAMAWLPIVGVALAATAVSVNKVASGLNRTTCIHCGADLSGHSPSQYGVPCPHCGGLHQLIPHETRADPTEQALYAASFERMTSDAYDLGAASAEPDRTQDSHLSSDHAESRVAIEAPAKGHNAPRTAG